MKACSVDGCGRQSSGRGLCRKHYQKWRTYGDALADRRKVAGTVACAVLGCGRPLVARGLCTAHYQRLQKAGDVRAGAPIKSQGDPVSWLREHVGHSGPECLTWPFQRYRSGYGAAPVSAVPTSRCVKAGQRKIAASRAMCILAHGDPPSREHVAAHRCGNGHLGCVHPGHLRWATHAENVADRLLHGILAANENEPYLNSQQIMAIRLLAGLMEARDIAAAFRISIEMARGIVGERAA